MRILALNGGSSSLKFGILEVSGTTVGVQSRRVRGGAVVGIGDLATLTLEGLHGAESVEERAVPHHAAAVEWIAQRINGEEVAAVGHRVVHGGDRFSASVVIDDAVTNEIDRLAELAPLHNPISLAGIRAARVAWGDLPMVAVFDTAFHRTLPDRAAIYAIPSEFTNQHRVRRYGFHGIVHASLLAGYAALASRPIAETRVITLHLGNGCSAAAIRGGQSVDTSMGFTPLEGLVMGTRCGDIDPSVVSYLAKRKGVAPDVIGQWFNHRSGLLGVSGLSADMRVLLTAQSQGYPGATRAIELFCYRVRKYIGAYLAVLGGAHAVVFGGGIGEHAPTIRASICEGMEWCGLVLDPDRNAEATAHAPGTGARISRDDAGLAAYVVAADEESWIAQETLRCLRTIG